MLCERTTEQALSERLNEYFWDGRVFEKVSQPVSARTLQLISEWSAGRRFCETFSAKSFHVRRTFKLKILCASNTCRRLKKSLINLINLSNFIFCCKKKRKNEYINLNKHNF